jgi:hypothetical protein
MVVGFWSDSPITAGAGTSIALARTMLKWPLATKSELHELRRYMIVFFEALRADIQILAEHVASVMHRPRE